MLEEAGAQATAVRRPAELDAVEGLVIPGGESTTIWKLAEIFDMLEPLRMRIKDGMPAYGSCAGMIMLADRIQDGIDGQQTIGGIDMVVRRNAFGRQVDSFESDLSFAGADVHAVFIRAPWVESVGSEVEVLATAPPGDRIVAVRQGPLLATSFHPELTGDTRVHEYFVNMVREL
ncbi:pyridoxal 5'-phosphate synthase glutaminase subunit PdxT [Nonomuraea roseola]